MPDGMSFAEFAGQAPATPVPAPPATPPGPSDVPVIDVGGPSYSPSIPAGQQGSEFTPSTTSPTGNPQAPPAPMSFAEFTASAPAPAAGSAPPSRTGLVANIGAGTSDAVANTLGAIPNLAAGVLNLVPRGINAVAGTDIPTIQNPVGGPEWWKSAEGLIGADPRNVAPASEPEQIGRAAGEGLASMVLPWSIARALPVMSGIPGALQQAFGAGSVPAQAVVGAGAGAAGQIAENQVPEPWKPLANFAGQMIGGGLALGSVAASRGLIDGGPGAVVANYLAPMTGAGQQRLAGQRIAGAATDPKAATTALANAPEPLVPGSQPTTFQVTGDQGLGSLERAVAKNSPDQFLTRANEQNAARVTTLQNLTPETASPDAVGQAFRQQLADLDADHAVRIGQARTTTQAAVDQMGAPTTPQQAGEAIRTGVAANWAPAFQAADNAVAAAQGRASAAVESLGGKVPAGGDQQATVLQNYGGRLRTGLNEANAQAKAAESRLWQAIDPNGTLAVDMTPVRDRAAEIVNSTPKNATPLEGEPGRILAMAQQQPAVQSFTELGALRSRITDAMRTELATNGRTQAYGTLSRLLDSVHDAMQGGVERQAAHDAQAVTAGQMSPEESMVARLHAETQDFFARRAAADASTRGGVSPDSGIAPGGRSPAVRGASVPEGQAGGRFGAAPGNPGLPGEVQPLVPNFDADAAARYQAARTATAERHATFTNAPGVGQVLAPGRTAGEYRLGDSQVPAAIFNGGKGAAERVQAFLAAGGSRPDLLADLKDYAAHDLRRAAETAGGTLDLGKYRKWSSDHNEAMSAFPELREQFETAAEARHTLDDLRAQRAALDAAYPLRPGWGDAEIAGRAFVTGPRGAEAVQRALTAIGNQPRAAEAIGDYAAWNLKEAAEKQDGTLDATRYARWMKLHDSALNALPDVRTRFQTAGDAQRTLDAVTAAHVQARQAYEKSAASHFLGDADPVARVGRILKSDTALPVMRDLGRLTERDPVARAGLQRAVVDYVLQELRGNTAAGQTGTTLLKSDQFQTFVRKADPALGQIFTPYQLRTMQDVAADLQRANHSVAGTKLPGGSNTAQDIAAGLKFGGRHPSNLGLLVASEAAGEALQHLAGPLGRVAGWIVPSGLNAMRQVGMEKVDDLVTEAMLNPPLARALLTKATPSDAVAAGRLIADRIRGLATTAAARSGYRQPKVVSQPGDDMLFATPSSAPRVSAGVR